jgi:N-acetylglutamate synthase-like GNAT family acetyltransferase
MNIEIRPAKPDDADTLTAIAHAAKRHWGYPEKWIAHWKPELTITEEFINSNEVFVAVNDGKIIGCCALVLSESLSELEHMWILPEFIGTGLGRKLFMHARDRAASLNLGELELSADPNAEGFYQHMGAVRIGEVRSEIDGQPRVLPRMKVGL